MMLKNLRKFLLANKSVTLIVLAGTLIWSTTMVKSGIIYDYGMGFWGPNGHDGVWHIALANSLARGSLDMPVFSGASIKNYHIGYDLLLAGLSRVTHIPTVNLYFQILPILTALLVGIFTYKFVNKWRNNKTDVAWALFFVFFGGSFGWIVTMLRSGQIGGESLFWSQQAISTLLNPPYAVSLIVLLLAMYFVFLAKPTTQNAVLGIVLFGVLIQIKVYAGILGLGGLLIAGVYELIICKKRRLAVIFLGALMLALMLFIPLNRSSSETVVVRPLWFVETMMLFSDRLGWQRYGEAMINYQLAGNLIKGIPAYIIATVIFVTGNMGIRFMSVFWVINKARNIKKIGSIDIFLTAIILGGIVAPLIFLQKGTPWNTIQFLYYSLFFSSIIAGIVISGILDIKKIRFKSVIAAGVIMFTLPTTLGTLPHYLPNRPPAKISMLELEALGILLSQQDGIVLSLPYDDEIKKVFSEPPLPLYVYESTAYVSAFSSKTSFLEDEVNLEITQYDWKQRRDDIERYLYSDMNGFSEYLHENNICYLYLVKEERFENIARTVADLLYENEEVAIYKVTP